MSYFKDKESNVIYLETDNPIEAWTSEEWAAKISSLQEEISSLQAIIEKAPKIKTEPDQECLDFWNNYIIQFGGGNLEEKLNQLNAELETLLSV